MRIKEKISYKIDIKIMIIITVLILGLAVLLTALTVPIVPIFKTEAVKIVGKEYSAAFSTSYFDEKIGKEITIWHDKVYYFIVKKTNEDISLYREIVSDKEFDIYTVGMTRIVSISKLEEIK